MLKQTLDGAGFEGLAGVYIQDLQTGQEIHFARQNGEDLPLNPDIAFTASSIIKIPIMVSAYRRMGDNPDSETQKLVADMIEKSGNEAADWLMERVIDQNLAPLQVSEDMQALGLENTFLAGKFTIGSPLLQRFDTPANTRLDINTDPDPYSQTTMSDIGMLLADIYQCAQTGGGTLPAVYPGEITQNKCQKMNTHLINNRLPVLITAGVPEGTQVAHKHGWVSTNGIINTIGDAGIVYTLGGNYVVVIFLHNPEQLLWDPASELLAILSQAVYNFYNPPTLSGG
jgi:beta-lactamase class A